MVTVPSLLLSLVMLAPAPLTVQVTPANESLDVRVNLGADLPDAFLDALPTGAVVRVLYPIRVKSRRSFLWDGRVWKGELTSRASFDPITGRYRCELLLDEIIVASDEVDTIDEAVAWLRTPPSVRLVLDEYKKLDRLYIRARAVFTVSTTWLVFTDLEGTDWVTTPVVAPKETPEGPPSDTAPE